MAINETKIIACKTQASNSKKIRKTFNKSIIISKNNNSVMTVTNKSITIAINFNKICPANKFINNRIDKLKTLIKKEITSIMYNAGAIGAGTPEGIKPWKNLNFFCWIAINIELPKKVIDNINGNFIKAVIVKVSGIILIKFSYITIKKII